jgi:hypothetical protein
MAQEVVLTGDDLQKLINPVKGQGILEAFRGSDPIEELVTLSSVLASVIVSICDDVETAVDTVDNLAKLQADIVKGLFKSGIVDAEKAKQKMN